MPFRLCIYTFLQSLTGDSTILISLLYSVAPEQREQFVDLFASILLRGNELCREATSEVLAEMLVLELDKAAWLHRDFHLFLRGQSHIAELVETLARRTITAPDGVLVSGLASICRALCDPTASGEDGGTAPGTLLLSPATAMMSMVNDSNRGGNSPGAWTDEGTATDAYHWFSTSELQGLATAEQQFVLDLGGSLTAPTATSGSGSPPHPAPTFGGGGVSDNGDVRTPPCAGTARSHKLLCEGLDFFNNAVLAAGAARLSPAASLAAAFAGGDRSDAVDNGASTAEEQTLSRYVAAIFAFLSDVMDLLMETVVAWPLSLRRALWLLMEAVAPPPSSPVAAERVPSERPRAEGSRSSSCSNGGGGTSSPARDGNPFSSPADESVSAAMTKYQLKHSAIATIVSLRIFCPTLLSTPSYILPVEEDLFGPVYLTTRKRVTLVAKLLQKAASGQLYDTDGERAYTPFNRVLPSLTRRWVDFFDALTDCGGHKSSLWSQPAPPPRLPVLAAAADSDLVARFMELMDQTFVQYQHVALLIRPFTESLHLSQWLRLTQYFARSQIGRVAGRATMRQSQPSSLMTTPVTKAPCTCNSAAASPSLISVASGAGFGEVLAAVTGDAVPPCPGPDGSANCSSKNNDPIPRTFTALEEMLQSYAGSNALPNTGSGNCPESAASATPSAVGRRNLTARLENNSSSAHLSAAEGGDSTTSTPTLSTSRGAQRLPSVLSGTDLLSATDEVATEAFHEVLAYIMDTYAEIEAENVRVSARVNAAATTAPPFGSSPGVSAKPPTSQPPATTTTTTAFLRNYCSVGGMATDGATTLIVYGDLLFCYLTRFYAREKENVETWQRRCPRFASYRARMAARAKTGGASGSSSSSGGGGSEGYKDGDAVALLYFLIHLSVTHNIRSSRFRLIFVHDNTRTVYSLGIAWLQEVVALMPTAYQHACCQIVLVKPKRNYLGNISALYRSTIGASAFASPPGSGGGGGARRLSPLPLVRVSQIQELPKALPFIATYLPLPIFEYQILMKERKKERATATAGVVVGTPLYGTLVDPLSPLSFAPAPTLPRRKADHVAVPFDQINHGQRLLDSVPAAHRYLHERWARPLSSWQVLRTSGIWMLQFTGSVFEVVCTATCRRSYADNLLYPLLGLPITSLRPLAGFILDTFATFTSKSLAYIGQEPKWLRESVLVTNGPVTASTSDLHVHIPPDVKLRSPDEDRYHSTWMYLGQSKLKEREHQQLEATFQRLVFISAEVDAIEEGRGWDQIVSTRWGLNVYQKSDDGLVDAGSAATGTTEARTTVSSRFVPCLRQVPLRSLWRLFLYNVQQTCTIVRTSTPAVCPFTKMAAAVEKVRVGLATLSASPGAGGGGRWTTPPRPYASAEPGVTQTRKSPRPFFPPTSSTCDDVVLTVAAQALAHCFDAEMNLVRLVVSAAAYVRNMHAVHLSGLFASSQESDCVSQAELAEILKRGVAELIFSRPADLLGEQRVAELLACHGKELMQRAGLPFAESCSWHPYSGLWYSS